MDRKVALTVQADGAFKDTLNYAKSAGFKYVNMGFGSLAGLLTSVDGEKTVCAIADELAKNGLRAVMTHAPYYDLRISAEVQDENINKAQLFCLKATKILGAGVCAFHPRTHFTGGENAEFSLIDNVKNFTPLVAEAKKLGVKVGIENLPKFPLWTPEFYSCNPGDHARLIDCFNDPSAVCAVWDTGHANLMKHNQAESIKLLGSRIEATHIHNNFKDDDLHFAPSVGNIDWAAVAKALKSAGYKGYFTCESNLYPNALTEEYIEHLYDCLVKIENLFNA